MGFLENGIGGKHYNIIIVVTLIYYVVDCVTRSEHNVEVFTELLKLCIYETLLTTAPQQCTSLGMINSTRALTPQNHNSANLFVSQLHDSLNPQL